MPLWPKPAKQKSKFGEISCEELQANIERMTGSALSQDQILAMDSVRDDLKKVNEIEKEIIIRRRKYGVVSTLGCIVGSAGMLAVPIAYNDVAEQIGKTPLTIEGFTPLAFITIAVNVACIGVLNYIEQRFEAQHEEKKNEILKAAIVKLIVNRPPSTTHSVSITAQPDNYAPQSQPDRNGYIPLTP